MKKYYKNPKKRELKRIKEQPLFNKVQLEFYEGFYKDIDRLEREWNLCRDQSENATKLVREKGVRFDTKMALQKITKYWNSRKLAMEKAIDEETLQKFKTKRNEPNEPEEKPDKDK